MSAFVEPASRAEKLDGVNSCSIARISATSRACSSTSSGERPCSRRNRLLEKLSDGSKRGPSAFAIQTLRSPRHGSADRRLLSAAGGRGRAGGRPGRSPPSPTASPDWRIAMREQVDPGPEGFERADMQRQAFQDFGNAVGQRRFVGQDAQMKSANRSSLGSCSCSRR